MELKNISLFKEKCLIGGQWTESITGDIIEVDNPASKEIIGKVPKCSTEETKKAIEEAILDGEIPNDYDAAFAFMMNNKESFLGGKSGLRVQN